MTLQTKKRGYLYSEVQVHSRRELAEHLSENRFVLADWLNPLFYMRKFPFQQPEPLYFLDKGGRR
jgi:hypothetical protein